MDPQGEIMGASTGAYPSSQGTAASLFLTREPWKTNSISRINEKGWTTCHRDHRNAKLALRIFRSNRNRRGKRRCRLAARNKQPDRAKAAEGIGCPANRSQSLQIPKVGSSAREVRAGRPGARGPVCSHPAGRSVHGAGRHRDRYRCFP